MNVMPVKYRNAIDQNGVQIVRTPTGIAVCVAGLGARARVSDDVINQPIKVEVDYYGRRLKDESLDVIQPFYRDFLGNEVDHLKLVIRVKLGDEVLAELDLPELDHFYSFMVLQGPQQHVTDNYVSVPPALHITDEVGAVWTLGFRTAPKEMSPDGEFAFNVLRDGVDTREVASRIERRNGQIRIFTRQPGGAVWKRWLGRNF